jgi:hypothetical protein
MCSFLGLSAEIACGMQVSKFSTRPPGGPLARVITYLTCGQRQPVCPPDSREEYILAPRQGLGSLERHGSKARIDVIENGDAREQVSDVADLPLLKRVACLQQHPLGNLSADVPTTRPIREKAVITKARATLKQVSQPLRSKKGGRSGAYTPAMPEDTLAKLDRSPPQRVACRRTRGRTAQCSHWTAEQETDKRATGRTSHFGASLDQVTARSLVDVEVR